MATTRATTRSSFEQVGTRAVQTARDAVRNPWVERLARCGLAARGVVYAVIGVLAVQAAFFGRGKTTDTRGAIQEIAAESRPLLALVAAGLLGYALWRLVQAVLDPEGKGHDAKGLAQRCAMLASGVTYAGLALAAVRALTAGPAAAGDGSGQAITASMLDKPFGRWVVALVGLGVIASGLRQVAEVWRRSFEKKLLLSRMDANERRFAVRTGQIGFGARGVVFLLAGGFLVQAAVRYDASRARGLRGALEILAAQPHGTWLLGAVASGLIVFGAYCFLEARYRRIIF